MMPFRTIFSAVLFAILASPDAADARQLVGQASVIDGDTIEIHGQRIRLSGFDAPESAQLCRDHAGKAWRCGQHAAFALADHIGRRPVTCASEGTDRYRRILARCSVAGQDLGEWMVRNGWAVPYYDRAGRYSRPRDRAAAEKRGIWSGTFDQPSDWRRANRR